MTKKKRITEIYENAIRWNQNWKFFCLWKINLIDNKSDDDDCEYPQQNVKLTYVCSSSEDYCKNVIGFLVKSSTTKMNKCIEHLDNCAQVCVFFYPELLTDIRPANNPLSIGLLGGSNTIISDTTADFKGFEDCRCIQNVKLTYVCRSNLCQ